MNIIQLWENRISSNDYGTDNPDEDSYVYVLFCPETNLHKIGITTNFVNRYQELCRNCGCHLFLKATVKLIPGIEPSRLYIERFLKDIFSHKRKKGEWFNLNRKDIARIIYFFYTFNSEDIYTERIPFLMYRYYNNVYMNKPKKTLIQIG